MQGDFLKMISNKAMQKNNFVNKVTLKDCSFSKKDENKNLTFKEVAKDINKMDNNSKVKRNDELYKSKTEDFKDSVENNDDNTDSVKDKEKDVDSILKFLLLLINEDKNSNKEKLSKINGLLGNLINDKNNEDKSMDSITNKTAINTSLLKSLNINANDTENQSIDKNNLFNLISDQLIDKKDDNKNLSILNKLFSEKNQLSISNDDIMHIIEQKLQKIKNNLGFSNNLKELNSDQIRNIKFNLVSELFNDEKINSIKEMINSINSKGLDNNNSKNLLNMLIKSLKETNKLESREKVQTSNLSNIETIKKESNNFKSSLNNNLSDNNSQFNKELKEENLLNKIIGNNDSKDVSPKMSFMQNLTNISSSGDVQDVATVNIRNNPVQDIIKTIKFMDKEGLKELTVKVNPKELGEITVKITMTASVMKATIEATSKETYSILQSNLNELKHSLQNENIKIQELNINLYNDDPSFYRNSDNGEGFSNNFLNNNNSNNRSKGNHSRGESLTDDIEVKEDNGIINMFA